MFRKSERERPTGERPKGERSKFSLFFKKKPATAVTIETTSSQTGQNVSSSDNASTSNRPLELEVVRNLHDTQTTPGQTEFTVQEGTNPFEETKQEIEDVASVAIAQEEVRDSFDTYAFEYGLVDVLEAICKVDPNKKKNSKKWPVSSQIKHFLNNKIQAELNVLESLNKESFTDNASLLDKAITILNSAIGLIKFKGSDLSALQTSISSLDKHVCELFLSNSQVVRPNIQSNDNLLVFKALYNSLVFLNENLENLIQSYGLVGKGVWLVVKTLNIITNLPRIIGSLKSSIDTYQQNSPKIADGASTDRNPLESSEPSSCNVEVNFASEDLEFIVPEYAQPRRTHHRRIHYTQEDILSIRKTRTTAIDGSLSEEDIKKAIKSCYESLELILQNFKNGEINYTEFVSQQNKVFLNLNGLLEVLDPSQQLIIKIEAPYIVAEQIFKLTKSEEKINEFLQENILILIDNNIEDFLRQVQDFYIALSLIISESTRLQLSNDIRFVVSNNENFVVIHTIYELQKIKEEISVEFAKWQNFQVSDITDNSAAEFNRFKAQIENYTKLKNKLTTNLQTMFPECNLQMQLDALAPELVNAEALQNIEIKINKMKLYKEYFLGTEQSQGKFASYLETRNNYYVARDSIDNFCVEFCKYLFACVFNIFAYTPKTNKDERMEYIESLQTIAYEALVNNSSSSTAIDALHEKLEQGKKFSSYRSTDQSLKGLISKYEEDLKDLNSLSGEESMISRPAGL